MNADTILEMIRSDRIQEDEKYRELIGKMESIIGNYCYNKYIQNYGPGGVYEGEGRQIKYPITYYIGSIKNKCHDCDYIPTSSLITGYYAFGANSLAIIKALAEIIELLEREYGLKLDGTK